MPRGVPKKKTLDRDTLTKVREVLTDLEVMYANAANEALTPVDQQRFAAMGEAVADVSAKVGSMTPAEESKGE